MTTQDDRKGRSEMTSDTTEAPITAVMFDMDGDQAAVQPPG